MALYDWIHGIADTTHGSYNTCIMILIKHNFSNICLLLLFHYENNNTNMVLQLYCRNIF